SILSFFLSLPRQILSPLPRCRSPSSPSSPPPTPLNLAATHLRPALTLPSSPSSSTNLAARALPHSLSLSNDSDLPPACPVQRWPLLPWPRRLFHSRRARRPPRPRRRQTRCRSSTTASHPASHSHGLSLTTL
uniref:Uncharacterized protein n=1 Tax=Aegilops tauschii subsp. strangulata TaxID=200361 RepID=A0A452YF42_AEGTS